jgi:hypothetical protein
MFTSSAMAGSIASVPRGTARSSEGSSMIGDHHAGEAYPVRIGMSAPVAIPALVPRSAEAWLLLSRVSPAFTKCVVLPR